jgi:predicted Rossmann fold nucleotide-binding protein DprA/Smf involved in DNA uptake
MEETAELAAWMALAWRSALPSAEQHRIALGPGPDAASFPGDVLAREETDLAALRDLGVRLLPVTDPDYPARMRDDGPVLLQVAGRAALLEEEGVTYVTGIRGAQGEKLMETLDTGGRAVIVLSKGMLKAKSLLRALHEQLRDGAVALVSGEPPRAAWGPVRDKRRDALHAQLTRTGR